jgi:hypothetical protein
MMVDVGSRSEGAAAGGLGAEARTGSRSLAYLGICIL